MQTGCSLPDLEKLSALRTADPVHRWESLDDHRLCILCDRTFTGHEATVSTNETGDVRFHCPTKSCPGTSRDWVHPDNPLISTQAWQEWERAMEGDHEEANTPNLYFRKTPNI